MQWCDNLAILHISEIREMYVSSQIRQQKKQKEQTDTTQN